MSLETGIIALAEAVGADVKALTLKIGDLSQLSTDAKNNLVAAINELSTNVLTIDDDAGLGDTGVTWSADKTVTAIQAAVDALVDGAPAALDTLNKLAAALGNDENLAQTISDVTGLSDRLDSIDALIGDVESVLVAINGEP